MLRLGTLCLLCLGGCSFRSLEPLLCPKSAPDCEEVRAGADAGPLEDAAQPPDAARPEDATPGVADGAPCETAHLCGEGGCPEQCAPTLELLHASDGDDSRIRLSFALRNVTGDAIELASLTVRYFFTTETGGEQVFECSSVISGDFDCDVVTFTNQKLTARDTNRYIEFGFTKAAGSLEGDGEQTGAIKGLIRNQDFSDFEQANDYSFAPEHTNLTIHERMTVYRDGQLVWGVEP
jgi:hypothetical protein